MRFDYADARMPVAMTKGGITYYLTYDQVGSLRVVADASGNVTKRIDYDSFGGILGDTNPGFTIPFSFAGGLHDRDTGLVRFGFRDYDPETGRWTAKDPIGFGGGDVDLYGYCISDPINWADPFGLRWYKSPTVWLDIIALASDIAAPFYPPAYLMGMIASISSTALTISQYQHGKAEWYDVAMSVGTTVIGFHPVFAIPADIIILIYDIWRAEKRGETLSACRNQ